MALIDNEVILRGYFIERCCEQRPDLRTECQLVSAYSDMTFSNIISVSDNYDTSNFCVRIRWHTSRTNIPVDRIPRYSKSLPWLGHPKRCIASKVSSTILEKEGVSHEAWTSKESWKVASPIKIGGVVGRYHPTSTLCPWA